MALLDLNLAPAGAVPPALIRDLAASRRLDISGVFDPRGGYRFDGPEGFGAAFAAVATVAATAEHHARLLREVLEQCAATGTIYAEIRLLPEFCGAGDPGAWAEIIHALRETADWGAGQGTTLRVTATTLRDRGPDMARKAALLAAGAAGAFVTGFALAGEGSPAGQTRDFAWAFDCAREAGLGLVADAGGESGADTIREVLRVLRVDRIGNGRRAIEDLALVDQLAEAGTVLDLCPAADVALGRCAGWRQHPAGPLYHRGVRITVSSVAPAFFRLTLPQIHERLHEAFDWDDGVFRTLAQTAAAAAFCATTTRDTLLQRLT